MLRFAITFCFLLPLPALAQPIDRYIAPDCAQTPLIHTSNYPGYSSVVTSNNLTQPAGKSVAAPGQIVQVFGRVLDRHCVPISQAKIELWQADPEGKHRYATKASLATPDPVFTGSGRASTDNLGQFQFTTLYPGPYQYRVKNSDDSYSWIKRAPYLNIRVSHPDLREFNSNLFFDNDFRNATDYRYAKLSQANKARVLMQITPMAGDINQGIQATIDIILPQSIPFRKY